MVTKPGPYITFFEHNKISIPNIELLINKLKNDRKDGHIVHAVFVRRFFEGSDFEVTDIEKHNGYDVDIELDNYINIQVWHGGSVASHNISRMMANSVEVSGGVPTDWDKDKKVIFKKLGQLPDNEPGFVICYHSGIGISFLPEWYPKIDDNKAVIGCHLERYGLNVDVYEMAKIYACDNFKHGPLAIKICNALGFNLID
ncbi:hypothetical protein BMS3Abin16_00608 [archaeon BMS3Abin16]|nr:hypothetical protein BMS3Abin16_00608 [archaeon BMS3Abin16]